MKKPEKLLMLLGVNEESFVDDALFGLDNISNNHPMKKDDPIVFEEFVSLFKIRFEEELHKRWESMQSLIVKSCWEHYTDKQMDALIVLYSDHPELATNSKRMQRDLQTIVVAEYTKIGDRIGEEVAREIGDKH